MKSDLGVIALALSLAGCSDLQSYPVSIKTEIGIVEYQVEVADNLFERSRGLMRRQRLAPTAGMLFIYENVSEIEFWMKDVSIPLDIIFINHCGLVVKIYKGAQPFDETPIPSEGPVKAALELNYKTVERDKIVLGNKITSPAISFEDCG